MITTATILSGVAQGLIWAILTLGVYLTFRILDIADLTVEGTFPLGAAVTVVLINTGMSPAMAMLCALLAGSRIYYGLSAYDFSDSRHLIRYFDDDRALFGQYSNYER